MRRVIRYDGLLPNTMGDSGHRPTMPDDVREMRAWVDANRAGGAPFDIIVEGQTPGKDPAKQSEIVGSYIEAGATWWIESMWDKGIKQVLERLKQGPPKI